MNQIIKFSIVQSRKDGVSTQEHPANLDQGCGQMEFRFSSDLHTIRNFQFVFYQDLVQFLMR